MGKRDVPNSLLNIMHIWEHWVAPLTFQCDSLNSVTVIEALWYEGKRRVRQIRVEQETERGRKEERERN
jgi:hypothetical protein